MRVVPRGAGTSLAGGSLPTADCVLLATASTGQFGFCRGAS